MFARAAGAAAVLAIRHTDAALLDEAAPGLVNDVTRDFEEYLGAHGKVYAQEELPERQALFQRAAEEVRLQNARPDRSWTAALNRFADLTPSELAAFRGFARGARPMAGASSGPLPPTQLLGRRGESESLADLPAGFTWHSKLKAMQDVQDQSSCGSCWAFASTTVLRAHAELYQQDRKFSVQQVVSCTKNPRKCGGDGGCKGATAELAMDYVARRGCAPASEWKYDARDSPKRCPAAVTLGRVATKASFLALREPQASAEESGAAGGLSFGLTGYRKLPENQLAPVMLALVHQGPVAVSLAAGRAWNMYSSGILNACSKDAVIDHAVTLVGYGIGVHGSEQGIKYWQIQNSWGPAWGESGFIRLARHDNEEEGKYCGMDREPQIGSGCEDGPPQVRICGSCGILYDAVVPEFNMGSDGLWSSASFLASHRANLSAAAAETDADRAGAEAVATEQWPDGGLREDARV